MTPNRENMIFPLRWFDTFSELEDNELREMMCAIGKYVATGEAPAFKGAMKALWKEIQQRIDADNAKYDAICEARRKAGAKGGQATQSKPKQTEANPSKSSNADTDADADINISVDKDLSLSTLSPKPGKSGSSGAASKPGKIYFDYEGDAKIHGITSEQLVRWKEQFPAIEVEAEIKSASAWLDGNRKHRKTDVRRFLTNWLIRKQDSARKAPDADTVTPRYGRQPLDEEAVSKRAAHLRKVFGDDFEGVEG